MPCQKGNRRAETAQSVKHRHEGRIPLSNTHIKKQAHTYSSSTGQAKSGGSLGAHHWSAPRIGLVSSKLERERGGGSPSQKFRWTAIEENNLYQPLASIYTYTEVHTTWTHIHIEYTHTHKCSLKFPNLEIPLTLWVEFIGSCIHRKITDVYNWVSIPQSNIILGTLFYLNKVIFFHYFSEEKMAAE